METKQRIRMGTLVIHPSASVWVVFPDWMSAANALRPSGIPSTASPTGKIITFLFSLVNLNFYEGVLLLQGWQFKRAEKKHPFYMS